MQIPRQVFVVFNVCEAFLWLGVGLAVYLQSRRSAAPDRRLGTVAAISFIAFGLSDLIELQTGAWWRPWPLLVLKGACILSLVACLVVWLKLKAQGRAGKGAEGAEQILERMPGNGCP